LQEAARNFALENLRARATRSKKKKRLLKKEKTGKSTEELLAMSI